MASTLLRHKPRFNMTIKIVINLLYPRYIYGNNFIEHNNIGGDNKLTYILTGKFNIGTILNVGYLLEEPCPLLKGLKKT